MGNSGMNQKLKDYLKSNFSNSKVDLFAVFIERCEEMAKINGLFSMNGKMVQNIKVIMIIIFITLIMKYSTNCLFH